MTRTFAEWDEILLNSEAEAVQEMLNPMDPDEYFTANEVFDSIINYNGGLSSGYQIRSIVSRVYGIEL